MSNPIPLSQITTVRRCAITTIETRPLLEVAPGEPIMEAILFAQQLTDLSTYLMRPTEIPQSKRQYAAYLLANIAESLLESVSMGITEYEQAVKMSR